MAEAVETYNMTQGATIRGVANYFDVPPSSLHHRISGRQTRQAARLEQRKLAPESEQKLVDWILDNNYSGFALNYDAIAYMAAQLDASKTPPGNHWVQRFMGRHLELKARRNRSIDDVRWVAEDVDVLNRFFHQVHDLIVRLELGPDQIFNCDEKGF